MLSDFKMVFLFLLLQHVYVRIFVQMLNLLHGYQLWRQANRIDLHGRHLKLSDWHLASLGSLIRVLVCGNLLQVALIALETIATDSLELLLDSLIEIMDKYLQVFELLLLTIA